LGLKINLPLGSAFLSHSLKIYEAKLIHFNPKLASVLGEAFLRNNINKPLFSNFIISFYGTVANSSFENKISQFRENFEENF